MNSFSQKETALLRSFKTPWEIQQYLDAIPYNAKIECKSPARVLREGSAHCFEGALFAACAMTFQGARPLVIDLGAHNDDDHVIAIWRKGPFFGAIGKSNFTTLRYREAVYRSLRELALSYFDFYFNLNGDKSLRRYSQPLDLHKAFGEGWMTTDEDLDHLAQGFLTLKYSDLVTPDQVKELVRVPGYMLEAGMLGADPKGLFKPR